MQVRVFPFGEGHREAAGGSSSGSSEAGVRAERDERDETVGKRIRDAELEKIPYVVVFGDRESEDSLAVRDRGGEQSTQSLRSSCVRAP